MKIDLYGISLVARGVTFNLWSPWRCMAIEHRLFEAIRQVPGLELVTEPDEASIDVKTEKQMAAVQLAIERVLKGWQEEASDAGTGAERRNWFWLLEADTDCNGMDHNGEASHLWAFLRLVIESGDAAMDGGKSEMIDLNGFGFKLWRAKEGE
jgi:hypothetical protein